MSSNISTGRVYFFLVGKQGEWGEQETRKQMHEVSIICIHAHYMSILCDFIVSAIIWVELEEFVRYEEEYVMDEAWVKLETSTGGAQYIGTGIVGGSIGSGVSRLSALMACLIEGRRLQSG